MDFAVFKNFDRQYLVKVGDKISLEHIEGETGKIIKFNEVLLSSKKDKIILGQPHISKAIVEAKILEQGRGKKINILKYKAKSRYRRRKGHRQPFTLIEITEI